MFFGLFEKEEKKVVTANELSNNVETILATFNYTINGLSNIEQQAKEQLQKQEETIKQLQSENKNLTEVINRSTSIRLKISNLLN